MSAHTGTVWYLSHPQVVIDPAVPVPDWTLNAQGHARVAALCAAAPRVFAGTSAIFTSPERKARDMAVPLAEALGVPVTVAEDSHENDRSATGYVPFDTFEALADAFFAHPTRSVRGWERACDAQTRIVTAVRRICAGAPAGNLVIVGHGAVGTLLFCALARKPISRVYDQGPGGGGNALVFDRQGTEIKEIWRPMEALF